MMGVLNHGLLFHGERYELQAMIPVGKLKDYIAFARKRCQPRIDDAAAATLVERYLDMRAAGKSRKVCCFTTHD